MAELLHPHITKVVGQVSKVVSENFTARFIKQGESPVYVQNGKAFSDGGGEIEKIPDWVMAQLDSCSDETRDKLKMAAAKK